MRSGLFKFPGTTARLTASKFFRDSSSFQVVLPGERGCKCNTSPLSAAWHATHLAWPGRLARKMGCTLVLKNSKSSGVDAVEDVTGWRPSACDLALNNPAAAKNRHATTSR